MNAEGVLELFEVRWDELYEYSMKHQGPEPEKRAPTEASVKKKIQKAVEDFKQVAPALPKTAIKEMRDAIDPVVIAAPPKPHPLQAQQAQHQPELDEDGMAVDAPESSQRQQSGGGAVIQKQQDERMMVVIQELEGVITGLDEAETLEQAQQFAGTLEALADSLANSLQGQAAPFGPGRQPSADDDQDDQDAGGEDGPDGAADDDADDQSPPQQQ